MRNVTEFMKKYRIESVAALAFSIMLAIAFDIEKQIPEKWFDVIAIVLLAAIVSFIVDKKFVIYENEIKQKLGSKEFN